jgi:putative N6-adenine-specific DNA methylase
MTAPDRVFAAVAPGLEPLVASELSALGITADVEAGGASWSGSISSVAMANLWLRTASRVTMRLGEFHARTFFELERHARRLPWERFVAPGASVAMRVTCRKSKLYHSGAVAQRMVEAVAHRVGAVRVLDDEETDDDAADSAGVDTPATPPPQLFVVRFVHDRCTVSADASGALLHRRGYRLALAKAPLRETMAAAMLLDAGYTGADPLLDPMCGSGTIPIEAALIARRIAPGARRDFAFMRWPEHDGARWAELVARARQGERSRAPAPIVGADRDAGAVAAARANAERANVARDVEVIERAVSDSVPPDGSARGLVAINPPYGVRVRSGADARNLYARLGAVLHERFSGWRFAMLSADRGLESQLRQALETRLSTTNGGIPVRLVGGTITSDGVAGAA